jgi:hypothetical protein
MEASRLHVIAAVTARIDRRPAIVLRPDPIDLEPISEAVTGQLIRAIGPEQHSGLDHSRIPGKERLASEHEVADLGNGVR